jgi:hypothetical protein
MNLLIDLIMICSNLNMGKDFFLQKKLNTLLSTGNGGLQRAKGL